MIFEWHCFFDTFYQLSMFYPRRPIWKNLKDLKTNNLLNLNTFSTKSPIILLMDIRVSNN